MARPVRRLVVVAATALATGVLATSCGGGGGDGDDRPASAARLYRQYCATCHGVDGQGGVGPSLVGVAERFPDIDEQVALVGNGFGRMPAFGGRLTQAEIRKIVRYERERLTG